MWRLAQSVSSVAQSCPTLCDPMDCRMPGFPVHHQLLEPTQLMSIVLVMPSNHLILCHPFLLLPSIFPASRSFPMSQFFASGGQSIGFSFSISSSNDYSGLISFRIDWLDLLAVQGTLESSPTPQFKSINSSALSFLYSPTLTRLLEKPKL